MRKFVLGMAVGLLLMASGASAADLLGAIRKRGSLVVGVKADYRPFGFKNEKGEIVGLEPELARDLAARLGVGVKLVPVSAADRLKQLQDGKIDVLIATLTDLPERRKEVRIIDPDYYSSGMNVLAKTEADLAEWASLEGKPVCGVEGAFYNGKVANDWAAQLMVQPSVEAALGALKDGKCVAFVYDANFIAGYLSTAGDEWEMPFRTLEREPWGIAIAKGDEVFATYLSGVVFDWHLSGRISELERKYDLPSSDFAIEQTENFRKIHPGITR